MTARRAAQCPGKKASQLAPAAQRVNNGTEMSENRTRITKLEAVALPVADQDRALQFYLGKLGFEKRRDVPLGRGGRWVEVAPPGAETTIALVPAVMPVGVRLATEDAEADHASLQAQGVDTESGDHAHGSRAADVLLPRPRRQQPGDRPGRLSRPRAASACLSAFGATPFRGAGTGVDGCQHWTWHGLHGRSLPGAVSVLRLRLIGRRPPALGRRLTCSRWPTAGRSGTWPGTRGQGPANSPAVSTADHHELQARARPEELSRHE
jgi:catechol 2,3-dioxygenase-like lactoylglutathione lyase family enzyme